MSNAQLTRLRILLNQMKASQVASENRPLLVADRFRLHAPEYAAVFSKIAKVLEDEGLACTPFSALDDDIPKVGAWIGPELAVYVHTDVGRSSHLLLSVYLAEDAGPRYTTPIAYRTCSASKLESSIYSAIDRGLRTLNARMLRGTRSRSSAPSVDSPQIDDGTGAEQGG